jgi:hypothetical protein
MIIKITQQVKNSINSLGNRTARRSGLKVYAALYFRTERKNEHGYFDCPATYLMKVNSRYYKVINQFIKDGIIKYRTNLKPHPDDIFAPPIITKDYSKHLGYCMQYKFLINIEDGDEIEVDFSSGREYRWYSIIENSLKELGYEVKISRDSFGRRVYHTVLTEYKIALRRKDLYVIDSKASQPRLLYHVMKERRVVDANYNAIFENEIYFYDYLIAELELKGDMERTPKDEAKDLFASWLNGRGYVPNFKIHSLFPVATAFLKKLKNDFYKDSAAFFQREEARIWIDDLLENIPVEFALPVHDSLIVKKEDYKAVLQYCIDKYPDLRFEYGELDKLKPGIAE